MKNRDALASLLLKVNDLGVLGRELDVDDINDLADYLDNNGAFVPVRCKDCIHQGYDACPMCHDEYYFDEDDGADYWTVDNTDDDGFCHKGAKE